jgi:hypothetical protein
MVFQTHLETLPTLEVSRELYVRSKQDILEVIRGPAEEALYCFMQKQERQNLIAVHKKQLANMLTLNNSKTQKRKLLNSAVQQYK